MKRRHWLTEMLWAEFVDGIVKLVKLAIVPVAVIAVLLTMGRDTMVAGVCLGLLGIVLGVGVKIFEWRQRNPQSGTPPPVGLPKEGDRVRDL